MHLFTRTRTIDPARAAEAHRFAVELSRYASAATGVDVIPWAIAPPPRLNPQPPTHE